MTTTCQPRLYAAGDGGAQRLELHPALGTPSRAIDLVAPGVYEGLRTFGRTSFFGLRSHLERLERSIAGFNRPLDYDRVSFVQALDAAIRDTTHEYDCEARIRIDVAAEPATALGTNSNVLIAITPFRGVPDSVANEGVRLRTACGLARPQPEVKTSNFIPLREAWIAAHGDPDAYEHIMLGPNGELLEGTQSNLLLVRDGVLLAPPGGVLPGVTMGAVIDLAREAGIEVRRAFTRFSEFGEVDEAFITTSVRSVIPVARLDDLELSPTRPVTRLLSKLYNTLTESDAAEVESIMGARY